MTTHQSAGIKCWKLFQTTLSKPRRRRQRQRHQTKGLMSKTIAVHVRYKSLYISLESLRRLRLRRLRNVDDEVSFFLFRFGIERFRCICSCSTF